MFTLRASDDVTFQGDAIRGRNNGVVPTERGQADAVMLAQLEGCGAPTVEISMTAHSPGSIALKVSNRNSTPEESEVV